MSKSDNDQIATNPQWAFERDLNLSGLVGHKMPEGGLYAVEKVQSLLEKPADPSLEYVQQMVKYGTVWLQEFCDSVMKQRKGAREMFMGMRMLIGSNVKAVKDSVKTLKAAQNEVIQVHNQVSNCKQVSATQRKEYFDTLTKIEKYNSTQFGSMHEILERAQRSETDLQVQKETLLSSQRDLCDVKNQRDEATEKIIMKEAELSKLQNDHNTELQKQKMQYESARNQLEAENVTFKEKARDIAKELEVEKGKVQQASEEMERLRIEIIETKKNSEAVSERMKREKAEKNREECLTSLRKAEKEIDYLTNWAHEKSMELQRKDGLMLERNQAEAQLRQEQELLVKERDALMIKTQRLEAELKLRGQGESVVFTRETRNSSAAGEHIAMLKNPPSSKAKANCAGTNQQVQNEESSTVIPDNVGGQEIVVHNMQKETKNNDKQKRTGGPQSTDRIKRQRTDTKQRRVKSQGKRDNDAPASARTEGIGNARGRKQKLCGDRAVEKTRNHDRNQELDDDFLVCDDLYSDNMLG